MTPQITGELYTKIKCVIYSALEEDDEGDIPCGDMELIYVDIASAIQDGEDLDWLFDTDPLTEDYCKPLFDTSYKFWNEMVTDVDEDVVET